MSDLLSASSRRYLLTLFIAGISYALVGFGSFFLIPVGGSGASLVWPVAAAGVTILWLWGVELWPALLLPLFFILLGKGYTPILSLGVSLSNVLESVVAVYLLSYFSFNPQFARLRDTLWFIATSIIATFVSSLFLTAVSYLFYSHMLNTDLWSSLWVGHAVSLMVLGPFLLYWFNRPVFTKTRKEILEGIVVFGAIALFSILPTWTPYGNIGTIPLIYVLVMALIWASLRTGPRGISLALALVGIIFSTGVLFGHAAVSASPNLSQALFGIQILIGVLAIIFLPFTSITEERKDAVRTLERHVGQLETALTKIQSEDQAKTDFIAILAHELRNPLSPILSSLELMKQNGVKPDNASHVSSIASHIHIMARLLDDLLDISRISQKKFKLEAEPVELSAIVTQTVEMVKPFMDARKHTLQVSIPTAPVWLNADSVRITQVFVNLLNNSAKYTDPGGKITFTAVQENNILVVVVKDNGIGIAPDRLSKVFEPFGGAEGHERRPGGLRIGLSLAKRMTEMHRGTIEVRSAGVGFGSEFVVRIPLLPTAPLPLTQAPRRGLRRRFSKEETTQLIQQNGPASVLVVDDNEPAALALGTLLGNNGHKVALAYNGAQALEVAAAEKPAVALLDIGLPDMDGHELARAMRERFGNSVILIAITGYGQSEDKMRAREAGFDEHVTKPVSIVDIERIISDLRAR